MKSSQVLLAALLFLAAPSLTLSAQTVVSPLSSPQIAAGGGGTASEETPFADRLNPAASAGKQRITLDASYFGLAGTGYGNAVNFGATFPQRWGVVSGGFSYWGADWTGLRLGHQGQLNVGLSKDLWEDLYVGANLTTVFGTGGWTLGSSVGMLQFVGDWGWAKDFRWGAAFRDMGGLWPTSDGKTSVPPAFTPAVGAEFSPWKDKTLAVVVRPELSFPTFKDINAGLGTSLTFNDLITVHSALRFDLADTMAGNAAFPISFGVGFKFFTDLNPTNDVFGLKEKGWARSEVKVNGAVMPLTGGGWAVGAGANIPLGARDSQAPQVKTDHKTSFISPNNDGSQDTLSIPIKITDQRYVTGYTLTVYDLNKVPVRVLQSRVTLPEAQGWDQLWNRLTYVKHGVEVPPALEWNGMTDAGTVAPDGTYTLVLSAVDDNGNRDETSLGTVVVKNTPPQAVVSAPLTEFNPVGPRSRLSLVQRGSAEDQWTGTVLDSREQPVLAKVWKNGSPDTFEWDGRGSDGRVVPDGVYSYALSTTDAAGNKVTAKVANLIVNSIPTPLDLKVTRTAFSPGGSGVKTIALQPKAGVTTGMTGWKLEILDKKGSLYRTQSGQGTVPSDLTFNGKDEGGNVLSEGEYRAKLTLTYSNGNQPEVLSPVFSVKNTPPQASVTSPWQVFSPGSEEGRGVLVFNQQTDEQDTWTAKITDPAGQVVRTIRWPGKADATFVWDGRGADGKILADGTYRYTLESVDRAGNKGVSAPVAVTIDTAKRSVLLASDRSAFTPASQGANGRVKFQADIKDPRGLGGWSLTVQDAGGRAVRTWSGDASAPGTLVWDGKDDGGQPVADGTYSALLRTVFGNGTTPAARSNPVTVKNALPFVSVTADALLFSPTEGSRQARVTLAQRSSSEAEWTASITKDGETVRTYSWKGQAADVVWDGTDDAGNRVPDGTYKYQITTTDLADNTVGASVDRITIDSRPTPLFLTVAAEGFSPNGDGTADTLALNTKVGLNEGIQSWKLEVARDGLGTRKTFSGSGAVPSQFVWDGTTDGGARTEDGKYSATLSVVYAKGNQPSTRSASFQVQAGAPQLTMDVSPQPFSPDNDGTADELTIGLGVRSGSPVSDWSLEILDPENHRFILFNGKGAPAAQLKWDGRSGTGELVQSASDYTAVFTVKDSLGNSAQVKRPLAVDVLVMKEGDRLRIIIPSITFAPNKPDFLAGIEQDKADKNVAVLKRLSEIFTKYQRYRIAIEGHAVMINWNDPVKGKKEQDTELLPLSQKRADAVKDYLVKLGIAAARIDTQGVGGARPLVPFSDADNRWKDRRVEFWLDRE